MTTDADAIDLCKAAERGDVALIDKLLAQGTPADPVPAGRDSPLCFAAMYGRLDAARRLLDAGANVSHRGSYGRTPLHYAAQKSLEATSLLLERGADIDARHDGDDDVLSDLITQDSADPAIAALLLDAGLDLSKKPTKWYAGRTHLSWALFCGREAIAQLLLARGVDPNERDARGAGAFDAVMSMTKPALKPRFLRLLVDGGIDPNTKGHFGTTLLVELAREGDVESVAKLLARGADPNDAGDATTPLVAANESGNARLRELLLKHGAKPPSTGLPHETLRALSRLEAAAKEHPRDPAARLALAAALLEHGFRAAAATNVQAAQHLGASAVPDLVVENPAGVRWRFLPFPSDRVVGAVDDARVPNARVRCEGKSLHAELPLAVVVNTACQHCDEQGETVCSTCDGSGVRSGFINADHEYDCPTRETCTFCGGTKFVLNSFRAGRGSCKHGKLVKEQSGKGYELSRCAKCGLPAITCGGNWVDMFACGECGRFACSCRR